MREQQILLLLHRVPSLAHSPFNLTLTKNEIKTLLHWVCEMSTVSLMLVQAVHECFPLAISMPAKGGTHESGRLPLHEACRKGCDVNVIAYLVRAYPEAIHYKDNYDKVPWVYAFFRHSQRRQLATLLQPGTTPATLPIIMLTHGRTRWSQEFPIDFLHLAIEMLLPLALQLTLEEGTFNVLSLHGMSVEGTLNVTIEHKGGFLDLLPTFINLQCPVMELKLRTSKPLHKEVVAHLPYLETLHVEAMHSPKQFNELLMSLTELRNLKYLVLNGNRNYHENSLLLESTFDSLDQLDLEKIEVKAYPNAAVVPAVARLIARSTKLSHVTLSCPLDDDASRQLGTALASNSSVIYLQLDRRVNCDFIIAALENSNMTLRQVQVKLATSLETTNMDFYCQLNQTSRQTLADIKTTKRQAINIISNVVDDLSSLYFLLRFRPHLWSK